MRIRILDWSLVSPFWGGFGYLILARGFGKFNSPSIAHRSHVKLPMQGAVGAAKGSPGWDIIALSVQIVPTDLNQCAGKRGSAGRARLAGDPAPPFQD